MPSISTLISILILTLFNSLSFAQTFRITGKVTDQLKRPVAFASVYSKYPSIGTSANSEGEFQLTLKPGNYELIFKAVGYKMVIKPVVLQGDQQLNVELYSENYQLNDVIVKASKEDPAYEIIRHAIKKRKTYLHEVKAFTADVYIKGLQKLKDAPKKFLGKSIDELGKEIGLDSNRRGIIYLSESESRYSFTEPDLVHEEMISSKVSGSNRAFSFNRASDMQVNFYENYQDWTGLSNRPLVSPIADNAFLYYRYKYIGAVNENGETVNKIQVIPKRQHDPAFSGFIYILEDSWRISALDLTITKDANINFVDTLQVNQQFYPVTDKIWMPSSTKFEFSGGVFGFKFLGYFIAVYRSYNLHPQLAKKDFNEVVRITKDVAKRDSSYWQQARPVPLTAEERTDYQKKDALAKRRESKVYLDSLDSAGNRFKPLSFLFGEGYSARNRYRKENFHINSMLQSVLFNTVEGFALNVGAGYTKQIDTLNNRYLNLNGHLRYGFSNKLFSANTDGNIPLGKATIGFRLGSDVVDLNNTASIPSLINGIYSLLAERNLQKLYRRQEIALNYSQRIAGGLIVNAGAAYADRRTLSNTSDFKIIDIKSREYTSNNPFHPDQDVPLFPQNQAFKVSGRLSYDFSNKYATYPAGRVYLPSKWPKLGVSYTQAFKGFLSSDTKYSQLSADLSKESIHTGMYGSFSFFVGAGKFLNRDNAYFPDYFQFKSNEVAILRETLNNFLLLDYYLYSTPDKYIEGHAEQNFSGFFLNKVPLIRKLKLQEIVGFNYLSTPILNNYSELTVGVQYLAFRLTYAWSFNRGENQSQGIRVSARF
ncbi:carboxypeptidase-like regulatory domain-containing protein [Pedobacter sp. HMF7647]|uniref:Carboxypeptidase-like regulatory domain-containing protein n=1 Tax=Hufsiella arboris TaxID=2695275 RepID=A0A7K1YGD3_9SPHI|nr:DUF5686 and carboxypeptidase regulatory-like domain-containing protein [Hufsiella arboris]MXV53059.1 carboxypeptidase-like regulatory domain-containing protein [Hufsiella arboris]